MKRFMVVGMVLLVCCSLFAGDIVALEKWDKPLVFKGKGIEIIGSGIDTMFGDTIVIEAAVKNTGPLIDILGLTMVIKDESGFPVFQIEFMEADVPTGVRIIKSCPFKADKMTKAFEAGGEKRVWSVRITRL